MIFSRNYLHINAQRQEFPEQGLELFDLAANEGDICRHVAGCIPLHWHSELELFVLLEGCVQVTAGGESHLLRPGEGCFINAEVLHSFCAAEGTVCAFRSFVFDGSIVGGMPGSVFDVKYVRPLLSGGVPFVKFEGDGGDEFYFAQFQRAFEACRGEKMGYEFHVREALSGILMYIKEKYTLGEETRPSSVQEGHLKEMMAWIDQNLEKSMKISEVAAAAGICPRECQRIFSRYLHCSPMAYLRRRRILLAADLLASTGEPVTDIALRCGFFSPSYFSSQFKRIAGKTPMEYRTAACGGQEEERR